MNVTVDLTLDEAVCLSRLVRWASQRLEVVGHGACTLPALDAMHKILVAVRDQELAQAEGRLA